MEKEKILVSASLLAADFYRLGSEVERMKNAGADRLHYDVMDGCFVPNISFGTVVLDSIKNEISLPVDAHLMIVDPIRYAEDFAAAGADSITVHIEAAEDIRPALVKIRECGCKAGLSLKPATPAEVVKPYLDLLDMILIMTVEPGFGGQSFMTPMLEKVAAARALADSTGRHIFIGVDGGINGKTAEAVRKAGADYLVSGSYLFKASDPAAAVRSLRRTNS